MNPSDIPDLPVVEADAEVPKVSKDIVITKDDDEMIVEFLTKGYTDDDIYHILPDCTTKLLTTIKALYYEEIVRGMRDYYLVRKQSDDKMDYLESLVLQKLESAIALEIDGMKILKMFQGLNSAKRRSEGEGQTTSTVVHVEKVVQLQMPARMLKAKGVPTFETNSNNEVIKVGDLDMVTATNTQVLSQLNDRTRMRTITDASLPVDLGDI